MAKLALGRQAYNDETFRTLPLMEGRTIKSVLTVGSFESNEVTGLRFYFTDGTEVTIDQPNQQPIDVARSRGLYP